MDEPFTPRQLWPTPASVTFQPTKETLTIIFFHGLQMLDGRDAWKTTWTNASNVCWPQEWLPQDLGRDKVRVLSMSYDSIATRWGRNQGNTERVGDIGSQLIGQLVTMTAWHLNVEQTIVLVGHSFGGLVIKSLVVEADKIALHEARERYDQAPQEMCRIFLKNIKGIIFYAVPHTGVAFTEYIRNLNRAFGETLRLAGIMKNLLPFQNDMEQLSVDFSNAIDPKEVTLYAFAETLKYKQVLVVPVASAIQLVGNNFVTLYANHVDICKPATNQHLGYQKLLEILKFIRDDGDLF